jgi:hypothetical protein
MITIFADTFMTATRSNTLQLRDVPPKAKRRRWHRWFPRASRAVDPKDI